MDRHGVDGPTALVETDGSLHVVDVVRFGPTITELADQQRIWDDVIGHVAPTLKPFVEASSIDVEGVGPHPKLRRSGPARGESYNRANRGAGGRYQAGSRSAGGPSRRRSRGDR